LLTLGADLHSQGKCPCPLCFFGHPTFFYQFDFSHCIYLGFDLVVCSGYLDMKIPQYQEKLWYFIDVWFDEIKLNYDDVK
jgi:hypothetical protein